MTNRECARCGEDYKRTFGYRILKEDKRKMNGSMDYNSSTICPECYEKFQDFMGGRELALKQSPRKDGKVNPDTCLKELREYGGTNY